MRYVFGLLLCLLPLFAEWQMFSDSEDTYIYNKATGEIYVRYRHGAKNYEDYFVKMPVGRLPDQVESSNQTNLKLISPQPQKKETDSSVSSIANSDELKKEAQKMQRKMMDNVFSGE